MAQSRKGKQGKYQRDSGSGKERDGDTGVFFSNMKKSGRTAPDWRGEIRLDPKFINELIENDGLIQISGWTKKTSIGSPLIQIKVNRWKPGDEWKGQKHKPEDDEYEVPL